MNDWSVSAMGRRNQVWRAVLGSAVSRGTVLAQDGDRHGTLSGDHLANNPQAVPTTEPRTMGSRKAVSTLTSGAPQRVIVMCHAWNSRVEAGSRARWVESDLLGRAVCCHERPPSAVIASPRR